MLPLLVAQLLLPVALVAWLAGAATPRSRLALVLRLASVLLLLWGIQRVGVWVFPPWWMPLVCASLAIGIVGWRSVRATMARTPPSGEIAALGH